jgi:hypothetical protein
MPMTSFLDGSSPPLPAFGPPPLFDVEPPLPPDSVPAEPPPEELTPPCPPEPGVAPPCPPEPLAPPEPVVAARAHSPATQTSRPGQTTPEQGSFPQEPVRGSQYEPSLQTRSPLAGTQRLGPQAPPPSPPAGRHTSPPVQAAVQPVGSHAPSTQRSSPAHVTPAQLFTQRARSNDGLGLHTSPLAQGLGSQGFVTHAPELQALPSAHPKKRQSVFCRHWPAKSPLGTQAWPTVHCRVKHGPWQPPLVQVHSGSALPDSSTVPAGPHSPGVVFTAQSPQASDTQ